MKDQIEKIFDRYIRVDMEELIDCESAIDQLLALFSESVEKIIGKDVDNYSKLDPKSLAYKELKRVAEIENEVKAEQRLLLKQLLGDHDRGSDEAS